MALFRYQRHPSPRRRSRPPQSCREGPKAFQDCGHPSNSTSHILPEPSRAKSTSSPRASLLAPLDLWTPLLLPSLVSSTALFHVAGDQLRPRRRYSDTTTLPTLLILPTLFRRLAVAAYTLGRSPRQAAVFSTLPQPDSSQNHGRPVPPTAVTFALSPITLHSLSVCSHGSASPSHRHKLA